MATKRKVIHSEGRGMIASVYHFLKEEFEFTKLTKEPNWDISHLQNISKRTAEATGVSLKTISRILKEERELQGTCSDFTSPMKKRRKRDTKTNIDNLNADVVRSTIQNFYMVRKEIPTLTKLRAVLSENIGFDGCLNTLRTLLTKLGYKWRKSENGRKVMTERHDVQVSRLKFLKKMAEYRSQGRPIVYTDERYVFSNKRESTVFKNGTRFLLVHAGTKDGFIEKSALVSKVNTGDHAHMSFDSYVTWVTEKLLPNLPERAVIVLDNAPHHNTLAEKLPTPASKKEEMKQWLTDKGIAFDDTLLKVELYDIMKKNKEQHTAYKIDDYAKSKGFGVIRLPAFHPELNAIQNIWGIIKNYMASKTSTDTENLIHESLDQISGETWRKTCEHVEKIEEDYLKYFDTDFEFAVEFQNDSDDSDTQFECSSDDD